MKHIDHYPGGKPIPTRRWFRDTDTVIGILAIAFLCAGLIVIWRT